VVLALLGEGAPEAGTLAEGSRRAAQITESAQRAAAEREAQQQAGRTAPGGRTARHPGPDSRGHDRRGRDGRGPDGPAGQPADRDRIGGGRGAGGGRPGRRVPVVPVTVALVLTAAVAFLLVHLAGGASPSHPPGAGGPATTSTSPVSSTDSATPSPRPTVPADLVGSWQGQVTLGIAGTTLDVKISLAAGSAGPDTIAYSSSGSLVCSGELTPLSTAASGALTLSQGIITGQTKCGNGPVILSSTGTGMSFTFRGKGAPPASGTLTKA
jgi:hypothetical protein